MEPATSPVNIPHAAPPSPLIGFIGGSGLPEASALETVEEDHGHTPYGHVAGTMAVGTLGGVPVGFIRRQGLEHSLLPSEVPFQANVFALKKLGVQYVVAVSAVAALTDAYSPGDLVVVDQFIDFTKLRRSTFFGGGSAAAVDMTNPVCAATSGVLAEVAERTVAEASGDDAARQVHRGGTYMCVEGPTWPTAAESTMFAGWGAHVVGMTAMPEARLAREAELAYAHLAVVVDSTTQHRVHKPAAVVAEVLNKVTAALAETTPESSAHTALRGGLLMDPADMTEKVREWLGPILRRERSEAHTYPTGE